MKSWSAGPLVSLLNFWVLPSCLATQFTRGGLRAEPHQVHAQNGTVGKADGVTAQTGTNAVDVGKRMPSMRTLVAPKTGNNASDGEIQADPAKAARLRSEITRFRNAVDMVAANASASHQTSGKCGTSTEDGMPSGDATPAEYCHFCRWCCNCNANDAMDCEHSFVHVNKYGGGKFSGAIVFCSTCESDCQDCSQFKSKDLCVDGDCCNQDWKHQPPFDATRGVGEYR